MTTGKIYMLTLTLLTGSKTPEGPGWYITGRFDEGEQGATIGPKKITVNKAQDLAREFGAIAETKEGEVHPFEVVAKGTEAAKTIIGEELVEAEREATRVGALRQAQGEFGD